MTLQEIFEILEKNHPNILISDPSATFPLTFRVADFRAQVGALLQKTARYTFWSNSCLDGITVGHIEIEEMDATLALIYTKNIKKQLLLMFDEKEQVIDVCHLPVGAHLLHNYVEVIRKNPAPKVVKVLLVEVQEEVCI